MKGNASLFAGSLVLIGIVLLFIAGMKNIKEKITYGVFLLFTVMIFYWKPLVMIFSMLREVESFWYRYGYVGIFFLIFIAASFYLDGRYEKLKAWMPAVAGGAFVVLALVIALIMPDTIPEQLFVFSIEQLTDTRIDYDMVPLISKIIFPVLIAAVMVFVILARKEKDWFRNVLSLLLAILVISEVFLGNLILTQKVSVPDGSKELREYIRRETALLDAVPDSSFARRIQTTYHGTNSTDYLYASYNEPMAYGFNSVTSFVSDPEQNSIDFIDRAGYAGYKDTLTVTRSENIALDSLLGVKYVMLSADDDNSTGLEFIAGIEEFKNMFGNPYAFPVAFKYDGSGSFDSDKTLSPEYLNDLFIRLFGDGSEVFSPLECESEAEGNEFVFRPVIPEAFDAGKNIIFADFSTNADEKQTAVININGNFFSDYFRFLAPRQVTVPVKDGGAEVRIVFNDADLGNNLAVKGSFYVLDLTKLDGLTKTAKLNCAYRQIVENGYARFDVADAKEGQSLFMSIPYERGWTLTVNGVKKDCDLIAGTLMSVPLDEGMNVVELDYEVPLKQTALYISIGGVVLFLAVLIAEELILTKKNKGEQE